MLSEFEVPLDFPEMRKVHPLLLLVSPRFTALKICLLWCRTNATPAVVTIPNLFLSCLLQQNISFSRRLNRGLNTLLSGNLKLITISAQMLIIAARTGIMGPFNSANWLFIFFLLAFKEVAQCGACRLTVSFFRQGPLELWGLAEDLPSEPNCAGQNQR